MRCAQMLFTAAFFSSAAASASPASAAHPFGDRALVHAREALDTGNDARALVLLQDSLQKLPPSSDMANQARFLAARAALGMGLHERGLEYLDNLESELPEVSDYVYFHRAHAYRGLGRWREALGQWRRISWRSPLASDAAFSIADAYVALSRFEQAAEKYDEVLEHHRRHDRVATARFARARVAEVLRDWETAGEIYQEIAFRSPLDYFAGESLRRFERLSALRRIEPAGFYDYLGRADRFLSARALEPARDQLDALVARATSSSRKRSLAERQAKLAYRDDRFEDARATFESLASQTSGARRIRHLQWASRSLAAQNRFDEAVSIYESLAAEHRDQREGRELLFKAAWLAYNGSDHTRSLALFRQFIDLYGADYEVDDATWFVAWNAYRLGDYPSALHALRTLRSTHPRSKLLQRTHYWEARIL
ncbi:MAG: tetratricopeptide repeat protein, partial [Myxococcota bacterium]